VSKYQGDLDIAVKLARQAGEVALSHYGQVERLTKTHAATTDEAVTVADREAQAVIVKGLRDVFPDDGIIGEESESGQSITATNLKRDGRCWVIDPIDGTNNFIAGLGNWAICIGLLDAGRPVAGVVYDVTRDKLQAGAEGLGSTINGEPTTALETEWSSASVVMLTSNLLQGGKAPAWACAFLDQTDWKVRMLGSAALECAMVGAGLAHGAVTVNGKLWDCVAPAAFTLAAGGRVTKLDGSDLFPYDVTDYSGAKVPFIATAPKALDGLVRHMQRN
jgi:fructose-1,6-bisphosphatase/inositol monophosphatase family enzyme